MSVLISICRTFISPMHSVADLLLPYVFSYKYIAIFIITYAGALLLPLPSGTIIAAATAFGTQGYLNPWMVFFVGVLGNVAGDNTGYWLARKYGIQTLEHLGFRKLIHSERFKVVEKQIDDHPLLTVFWSRYLTAIAPTVNIIAGLGKVSFKKYFFFEATGEIAEVGTNFAIGYAFGENWEYFNQYMDNLWIVMVGGALFSYMIYKIMAKRHRRTFGTHN